eukprot:TRINITY_DN12828_c0_g1_i1.p1 TRINITY_DN12828_c0_g1~~TRINITY_DN12828_c0_g1_i1.p1  ORF type:complete len:322 (-),score=52.30 TRINITY_DN12828_c0_g1_i1:2-829(-)
MAYFNRIYQFWVHTQLVGKLGFLEYILVTPSNHRAHHGQNTKYIDINYGGTLIIWDILFGTFAAEDEEVRYGITEGVHSWSPIWANTHYFAKMYEMSKQLRGLSKLQVIFRSPSWQPPSSSPSTISSSSSPSSSSTTSPSEPTTFVKFDKGTGMYIGKAVYLVVQFAMAVVLRKVLEVYYVSFSLVSLLIVASSIIAILFTMGLIFHSELTTTFEMMRIIATTVGLSWTVVVDAGLPVDSAVNLFVWLFGAMSALSYFVATSWDVVRSSDDKKIK